MLRRVFGRLRAAVVLRRARDPPPPATGSDRRRRTTGRSPSSCAKAIASSGSSSINEAYAKVLSIIGSRMHPPTTPESPALGAERPSSPHPRQPRPARRRRTHTPFLRAVTSISSLGRAGQRPAPEGSFRDPARRVPAEIHVLVRISRRAPILKAGACCGTGCGNPRHSAHDSPLRDHARANRPPRHGSAARPSNWCRCP